MKTWWTCSSRKSRTKVDFRNLKFSKKPQPFYIKCYAGRNGRLNYYISEAEALDAKYHQLIDEVRTEKNAIIDDVNTPVGE